MKKVTITRREVYHKIASIDIEIPSDVTNVEEYLFENYGDFVGELQEKLDGATHEYGFGLGDGMDEKEATEEVRYDVYELKKSWGGHL